MKSNITILFLLLVTILFSCNNNEKQKEENISRVTEKAIGQKNEIILVIEDKLWERNTGQILREIFEKEIYALTPSTNFYNFIQKNQNEFSKLNQTHKNILFVSEEETPKQIKNKWAKDQIVMYINSDLNEIDFRKSCQETLVFLNENELENTKRYYEKEHNKEARLCIEEQFRFELFLPLEYRMVKDKEKEGLFIADLHKSSKERDLLKYIIVYQFEPISYDLEKQNLEEQIISNTNSILKQIPTNKKNSYVQIDNRVPLIKDNEIYRSRWLINNGNMAGPIIIKTRYIEDKVVVSLGIVFYPNANKRDFVRTFEAIL